MVEFSKEIKKFDILIWVWSLLVNIIALFFQKLFAESNVWEGAGEFVTTILWGPGFAHTFISATVILAITILLRPSDFDSIKKANRNIAIGVLVFGECAIIALYYIHESDSIIVTTGDWFFVDLLSLIMSGIGVFFMGSEHAMKDFRNRVRRWHE